MTRFGSIALLLVFAAGCTGRDGVRDAGDAVRGLVRVDLSYTRAGWQHHRRPTLRRAGALRPLSLVRSRQRADHPRLRRLRRHAARQLQGVRRHRRARPGARRRQRRRRRPRWRCSTPATRAARSASGSSARSSPRVTIPSWSRSSPASSTAATRRSPVTLALGQPYQVSGDGGDEVGPFTATRDRAAQLPDAAGRSARTAAPTSRSAGRPTRRRRRRAAAARGRAGRRAAARRTRPLPRARRRRLQHCRTTPSTRCRRQRSLVGDGDGDPPGARALLRARRRPRRAHPGAQGRSRAPGQSMSWRRRTRST